MRRKEAEKQRLLEQKKIVVAPEAYSDDDELPENLNRLRMEGESAGTVEEAIRVLQGDEAGSAHNQVIIGYFKINSYPLT